jgi:hypothetical protein
LSDIFDAVLILVAEILDFIVQYLDFFFRHRVFFRFQSARDG